jgi:hypothetical protein
VTLASIIAFNSDARCSRIASSIDRFTHQPAAPNKTAAMIGQAQSCRRRNRPVACIFAELLNHRETTPETRPTADREIDAAEVPA